MRPLASGERIHLINKKGDPYPLLLKAGALFQFSGETIAHDAIIGLDEGSEITLSRGTRFFILRPTLAEYILHMPRGAQILYPKDLALICMWADIYPGATVLEAGIGSGALTIALLNAVGEKGRVVSYELREDFARRAVANIEAYLGQSIMADRLLVRQQDVYEGIEEAEIDRVVLDLPEPQRVVPHAAAKLRPGGIFLSFVPTVPQIELVVAALRREGFAYIETFETLLRGWNIDGRSVRPDLRMVAHSGFITTARRLKRHASGEATPPPEPAT
ncbi:MAG: tRNA (adenine-N1)-methyltransferase [Nitrospirae bacterium]|nr:tRNA (adenine-N1)-methyltransferase [Candidatus Manganitrophaceae bacterium]